jgi:VWFA-related protein
MAQGALHETRLLGVAALCCCGLTILASEPPQSQGNTDRAVFRASTDLVRLEVSVVDANGGPVPDLLLSDFELLQDGRRQHLLFAQFRGHEPAYRGGSKPETPSEKPSSGRLVVIIVDDLGMTFDSVARVRAELMSAVSQSLAPDDQAMIVGSRDGRGKSIAFTTDPAVLREQVQALRWEAPTRSAPSEEEERRRGCRAAQPTEEILEASFNDGPLEVVSTAVSELRSYPGRKVLLLLADGISDGCPEYRSTFDERLRRLTDIAGRSSSVIYALQTRPFSSGLRMPDQRAAGEVTGRIDAGRVHNEISERLRKLAEPTGGFARRSNSVVDLIGSALTDQNSYYLLAYEPPPGTFTSQKLRYRKIEVRVSRKNVSARWRAGFYSVDDASMSRE